MSEKNEQKDFLYSTDITADIYIRVDASFLALFLYVNKWMFYIPFSKKHPVSRKKLSLSTENDKDLLNGMCGMLMAFITGIVLLGGGIPLLCLDIF